MDDIVLTASSPHLLRRTIEALQQELNHFLGMEVQRCHGGLLLTQSQYMLDILERAGMSACKPCSTLVDINPKVSASSGSPVADATTFRSLALYLSFTWPEILSQFDLVVYSDADWAGCPDTCKSTSGYAVFLGDNLVSWSSKRQNTVSRSSAEAKYRVVANAVDEASWLQKASTHQTY